MTQLATERSRFFAGATVRALIFARTGDNVAEASPILKSCVAHMGGFPHVAAKLAEPMLVDCNSRARIDRAASV